MSTRLHFPDYGLKFIFVIVMVSICMSYLTPYLVSAEEKYSVDKISTGSDTLDSLLNNIPILSSIIQNMSAFGGYLAGSHWIVWGTYTAFTVVFALIVVQSVEVGV